MISSLAEHEKRGKGTLRGLLDGMIGWGYKAVQDPFVGGLFSSRPLFHTTVSNSITSKRRQRRLAETSRPRIKGPRRAGQLSYFYAENGG